jgi:hypothetical protein
MKICTLSPQGNGQRNGGIVRFSGALYSAGVDNLFWEIGNHSWNGDAFPWEGTPFRLENEEDEKALIASLEKYDIVINNWPTLTTNEHNSFRVWNVWKSLQNPLRVTVLHNTILSAVRKENLSPLVWSASDYLLVQVSEDSTLCKELTQRMPWLEGKFRQFRQSLDVEEFRSLLSFEKEGRDNLALWVGRWEGCRNTARWSTVLQSAIRENYSSNFLHCAIGLDSDVKTYWGFFNADKGKHVRLNQNKVNSSSTFLRDGIFLRDQIKELSKKDILSPNEFYVFGPYEYATGMKILSKSAFGISTFGAWRDDIVEDYRSLAKLEFVSLEIMLLSLPVFDRRHLESMSEKELLNAPWIFKSGHDYSDQQNVDLLKHMEEVYANPSLYRSYRESCVDYVTRKHSIHNFIEELKALHTSGKTRRESPEHVISHLYGKEINLTDDLWVSLQHSKKGIPHYIEWDEEKMNITPRKETPSALF